MGPVSPALAAAGSIGALALDAGGSAVKGFGEKEGQDFMAAQAERAAALGRIKGDQTDAHLRDELQTTLGNIDVVRAAAGADPFSPTALAIKANETEISDRNRITAVGNIRAQADEREAEARFRRSSGKIALLGGFIGAGAKVGKGLKEYGRG
jgi:hypothetical protein